MKLLSERPEALRGDSKVHSVYMDFTPCDFAMHPTPRHCGENVHVQHISYSHYPDKSRLV